MTYRCHLAILGGGCAGLSVASRLIKRGYDKPMIIVEPRQEYLGDRTWSFWAADSSADRHLVHKKWKSWVFSKAGRCVQHSGFALSYQQIRAIDFYKDNLACLKGKQNVSFWQGAQAGPPNEQSGYVGIETSMGQIHADYVVDTRPRHTDTDVSKVWQVFSGGDVELTEDSFDPTAAQIMTNMISDSSGLKFTYVLPHSPRHALVQTTRFAPARIDPFRLDLEFRRDLADLTKGKFSVKRWERGCLPMGQAPLELQPGSRTILAGQANGALRPATGYGFLPIQEWAFGFAKAFASGDYDLAKSVPVAQKSTKDHIFLRAFLADPSASSDWFISIAEHLSGDEFGRFISQKPGVGIWAKVIWSLPKKPFLRSVLETGMHD